MKRKRPILIFVPAICLFLTGCNTGENTGVSAGSNKTAVTEAQTYSNRMSNENSNDISEKLAEISKKLKALNIADSWAGYDSKGQTAVCINAMSDRIKTHLEMYGENYEVFLAKTVFDAMPDVETVYYAADGGFTDFSRAKYIQNSLDKAPSDPKAFDAVKTDWSTAYDTYYSLNNTVYEDSKYNPQYSFERLMRNYFSGRLAEAKLEYNSNEEAIGNVIVNGIPENVSLKAEIASVLVMSLGRFSDNLRFDNIMDMKVTYRSGNKDLIKVTMLRGAEGPAAGDYLGWQASGLKPNDWTDYAKVEVYDKSINLDASAGGSEPKASETYEDPGYDAVRNKLESYDGVKDLMLGFDGVSYIACVTLSYTGEKKDFQKEMDMALEAMKYTFEMLWFKVVDNNGFVSIACIDRERFDILMYMKDSGVREVFDFPPLDWPVMAKSFGEPDFFGEIEDSYNALDKDELTLEEFLKQADSFSKEGQIEKALKAYDKAISIKPDYAEAYYGEGLLLEVAGRYDEAIEALDRAIGIKKDYSEAYFIKGVALRGASRYAEAIEALNRAIELDPRNTNAYINKSRSQAAMKKHDEAQATLDAALAISPEDASLLFEKAIVYSAMNEPEKAIGSLSKAISLDPFYSKTAGSEPAFSKLYDLEEFKKLLTN